MTTTYNASDIEVLSGLDPVNSAIIKDEIHDLAEKGTTIIFSTHRMEQVEEICQDIALINKGKVVLHGNVNDIKENFKQHIFQLEVDGKITGFDSQIISQKGSVYRLQFNDKSQVNQLLSHCLQQQLNIKRFNEELPSLNDIFIGLVEGKGAARQFENTIN